MSNSLKQKVEKWLPEAGRWGKQEEIGKTVQISGSKTNKVWGSNVKHGDYS